MGMKVVLACVLAALEGYLLGSVVFGILISKWMYHDDVRTHGSGSAGMTNMIRNYGKLAGALTAIGDVAKGFAAVYVACWLFRTLLPDSAVEPMAGAYIAGIFAVIGHTKPVWFGFKGGKGVLVGAGVALATGPLVCAVLVLVFAVEFAITRIVSLGSIIVAGLYPIVTVIFWIRHGADLLSLVLIGACSVIMAIMVIWMHRSNIERLRAGTEYRFGEKKKSSENK